MKLYEKKFVNPLQALAFKDGVEFASDPDLKALEPKKEGPNEWVVLIEDSTDDDEDDDDMITVHATGTNIQAEEAKEASVVDMKPLTPRSVTVNNPAVKSGSRITSDSTRIYPCGNCLNCNMGQDCIEEINEACRTNNYRPER